MSEEQKKWQNILDRIRFWSGKDRNWQDAINNFCKTIAPTEYAPVIDSCYAQAFVEGFCGEDKHLKDDFEYWMYETSSMEDAHVERGAETWNFKKDDELIDYLIKSYPLKFKP